MKVEKVERVEAVTLTLDYDQLYDLKQLLHGADFDSSMTGVPPNNVSRLRDEVVLAYQEAERQFGEL